VLLSIWDDGYGISVPNEYQLTKGSISAALAGFQRDDGDGGGFEIHRVHGWDYPALCETYVNAARTVREGRIPAIVHVTELTQPQGHSTSGSHERYKSPERLAWEEEFDCVRKMREWIVEQGMLDAARVDELEAEDRQAVLDAKDRAWRAFIEPIQRERDELIAVLDGLERSGGGASDALAHTRDGLRRLQNPLRRDLMRAAHDALVATGSAATPERERLLELYRRHDSANRERYGSHLHSESAEAALRIEPVAPRYDADAPVVRGFELLNRCFDLALERRPELVAFGEDLGKLGDVNQGFAGLQEKYGELRVADAGIREATLVGQAIGLAMRGLRPIVEIQYLDYLLYALQVMSDDLATVQYRTRGGQKSPVIVRTRGHRLEGIWHSGSPMAGIINLVRGMYVCVPRDMTRAAGFYNTLLQSDDCALIVEVLNGYRIKERMPSNLGEMAAPLGVPDLLREGSDVTLVTYGACCRIALEACAQLAEVDVDVELIDVQTLLPFDREGRIVESLKKTGRAVFLDEDVPGGTTAYMMQQVIDGQGGYHWLDSAPVAVSARAHRPAYGSDGDYWSKPNRETIFRAIYALMQEAEPDSYPELF
jgi:pyruvate/2-oxoglutarate/acetoin dehydrogenase E1 component